MGVRKSLLTMAFALGVSASAWARVDVGIRVGVMPPPPRVVGVVGVAPGPGYVWTNGYWDWSGGRWVWVEGRWLRPPGPHRVWVEPRYHRYHGYYHYHHGYWR